MPRGDGTGPDGQGPMTGRAMGYCAGNNSPGYMNPGFGRGMGFRRGFGRGFRARALIPVQPVVISKEQEKQALQEEKKLLEQERQAIEKRLKELK